MKFFFKKLLAIVVAVGASVDGPRSVRSSMTRLFSWTDVIGQTEEYMALMRLKSPTAEELVPQWMGIQAWHETVREKFTRP